MGLFSKRKGGWLYIGESTRNNNSKEVYTGITRRPLRKRWGEHIRSQFHSNKKTWVSKGKYYKPLGAVWSRNPEKAERTVKRMNPYQKRALGRAGATRYYNRKYSD